MDQNLNRLIATEAEPGLTDLKKAWRAGLEHAEPSARPEPHLRQSDDPANVTRDLGDFRRFAAVQELNRS